MINLYKQLVRGEEVNGDATASSIPGMERAGGLWGAQVRGGMTFSVTTKVKPEAVGKGAQVCHEIEGRHFLA